MTEIEQLQAEVRRLRSDNERPLNLDEIADWLQIDRSTLWRWRRNGFPLKKRHATRKAILEWFSSPAGRATKCNVSDLG